MPQMHPRSLPDSRFCPLIAAVPVRNEEDRIAHCLEALDGQIDAQLDAIVLLVNNTTDGTIEAARAVRLRHGTDLHIIECTLSSSYANAGEARRLVMEEAARRAGDQGVLLTTDADGIVDPTWLAANIAALESGADAVAGWVDIHPLEWSQIPLSLHEDDARECAYDALCDEIHAWLDPDPFDPLPRHTQNSGASIAVTVAAYRQAGGIPTIASGEDRAFIEALRRVDARIRHAPEVHVTVSGRIEGRAPGGMADTIRRRLTAPDPFLDDRLEPAENCARRAWLRCQLRCCIADPAQIPDFALATGLEHDAIRALLERGSFGKAWQAVETQSPILCRTLVAVKDLPARMADALALCKRLRMQGITRIDETRSGQAPELWLW